MLAWNQQDVFCFLNQICVAEKKNKRLIKHQGANRANNRQDKVKHIDLNTQEQGKVIGHTGAAH